MMCRSMYPAFGAVLATLATLLLAVDTEAQTAYPHPTTLYQDQFEVGDLMTWRRTEAAGGGTVELETAIRHSGRYAARFALPAGGEGERQARLLGQFTHAPLLADAKELNLRFYAYFADGFTTADGAVPVLGFGSFKPRPDGNYEGNMVELAVRSTPASLVLCAPGAANAPAGTTALPLKTWQCIEVRVVPGEGEKAAMTVTLNGRQELTAAGIAWPRKCNGFSLGLQTGAPAKSSGTMIVDDVILSGKPVGPQDVGVYLAHPHFPTRVGAPVVAILTGDQPTDRLAATFTSKAGLKRTVCEKAGPLGGRVDFRVDLNDLPASTYTLKVQLLDAAGKERAAAEYTYQKLHQGNLEYSIDATNAFVHNGKRFFPVTSFGLRSTQIADWKAKGYCNLLMGMEWNDKQPGVPGYKAYLDAVAAAGMDAIGPAHDYRFDRPGKPQWTADAVKEYLTELGKHPGVAWWLWREEPINWKYTPGSQKAWWDLVTQHDPAHMTEILDMGDCYSISLLRAELTYMVWPWLCGDVYSWDIYPIENEKTKNGSFVSYARVADQSARWNMGLVPVLPNVAPADCTPGKGGGTPTVQELNFVCWLSIVHEAKGIHWYPYQGKVPPENFEAMTKFVQDTVALNDAILGDPSPVPVTKKELDGGRVDCRATTDGQGNVYVFAVNLERTTQNVLFTLGDTGKALPASLKVEVYGENRTIRIEGSAFRDAFDPLGVHIYKLTGLAK